MYILREESREVELKALYVTNWGCTRRPTRGDILQQSGDGQMTLSELKRLRARISIIFQRNNGVLHDRDVRQLIDIERQLWQALVACGTNRDKVRQEISETWTKICTSLSRYFNERS